jgi:hypothetical protein
VQIFENSVATNPLSSDSDGDGMDDGWELDHNLDPLAQADGSLNPDHDGFTNVQEFEADTDPSDGTSFPKCHVDVESPSGVSHISFPTSSSRIYHVEYSSDLSAGSWQPLASNIQGTGETITVDDPTPISTARFYRVQIEAP